MVSTAPASAPPTAQIPKRPPPVVGDLNPIFEGADLMADPGLNLLIYTAEPGSRSSEALQLRASWAVTRELEHADEASTRTVESSPRSAESEDVRPN